MDRRGLPATGSVDAYIEAREVVTKRIAKATNALLDAALGLDAALEYLAEGNPAHNLCYALAAQAHIASAAVQTLLDDIDCGRAGLAVDSKRGGI